MTLPVMTRSRASSWILRVVLIAVIQALLLGVAVWEPLSARLTGTQITLRAATVDPLDVFRGAYVDLSYPDLPGQPGAEVELHPEGEVARGTAYVPLTRRGEVWVGGTITRTRPAEGLYLACDDSSWRLRCGIESWFLPQAEAARIGELLSDGSAIATVRVDSGGRAALMSVEAR